MTNVSLKEAGELADKARRFLDESPYRDEVLAIYAEHHIEARILSISKMPERHDAVRASLELCTDILTGRVSDQLESVMGLDLSMRAIAAWDSAHSQRH